MLSSTGPDRTFADSVRLGTNGPTDRTGLLTDGPFGGKTAENGPDRTPPPREGSGGPSGAAIVRAG